MTPVIKMIYCMLINKGKIYKNAALQNIRSSVPITINESYANKTIQNLLNAAAEEAGVSKDKVSANITNFNFCHFYIGSVKKFIQTGGMRKRIVGNPIGKKTYKGPIGKIKRVK